MSKEPNEIHESDPLPPEQAKLAYRDLLEQLEDLQNEIREFELLHPGIENSDLVSI